MTKAIFLDRDGVVNRKVPEGSYIQTLAALEFLPGALETVAEICRSGYLVFVVTNQRGVARGMVRPEVLDQIHSHILEAAARAGGRICRIYVCPHDIADACECRKPKPGMLLQAKAEFGIDMGASWMIGDAASDVAAGAAAGCGTVLISPTAARGGADKGAETLRDAFAAIQESLYSTPTRVE